MIEVKPFIKCVDYWPGQIPPEKLQIYKQFIREKQITKPLVLYGQATGSTTVMYEAIAPHKWILEEMTKRLTKG